MFEGFGPEKMLFVMVVLLFLFGAKRIPEIGGSLGKGIREFKKSMSDAAHDEPSAPKIEAPQASLPAQLPSQTQQQPQPPV